MPPLPPVGNVIKVELIGNDGAGYPWVNVLHFLYSGPSPSPTDLNTFCSDLHSLWSAYMAAMVETASSLTSIVATDLTSPSSAQGVDATVEAGTRTGSLIPSNAAFLISYPGAGPRYRGGHPRQYLLCGVQADLLDSAHWTTEFYDEVQIAWNDFCDGTIGGVYGSTVIDEQVAVSYYTTDYGPPKVRVRRAVPEVYSITSRVGNVELASQRGRIGRRR